MGRKRTTPRRKQLGRALRDLRKEAGLTLETAAKEMFWSSSKLGRVEQGTQSVDIHGVRSLLDLYDIGGSRWSELTTLAVRAQRPGWWRSYGLSDQGYVPLEAEASRVRDYTLAYVPGLLQTADYAREIFQTNPSRHSGKELANAVAVRMVRQRRLTSDEDPLELEAIFDEAVLLRPVGGPEVMRAQLTHLAEAAGLPSVTVRVLPLSLGARRGLSAVFTVLSFDTLGLADMAYVEHPLGAIHLEKDEDVARATLAFDRLRSLALDPDDSVRMIRRAAEQYAD